VSDIKDYNAAVVYELSSRDFTTIYNFVYTKIYSLINNLFSLIDHVQYALV